MRKGRSVWSTGEDGLLAVYLGPDASPDERARVSDRLREFGGAGARWEEGRAVFALRPERLPPEQAAADNVLRAALELRELLLPTSVALACDVIERSATEEERELAERLLAQRVERHPGALVMTRAVAGSRAAREVPVERIVGEIEALFRVVPGSRARIAPVGRWVAPQVEGGWERSIVARAFFGSPVEDGLLVPERVTGARDASELLLADADVVEVVAPAWTGKTYLSGALRDALDRSGTPCRMTGLEHREGGDASWPEASFLHASGERVWIVDALDEGRARDADLRGLRAAGAHPGLRTIILGRPDERVRALLDRELSARRETFELLPLDREAVLREVCEGDSARLERLLAAAREMKLDHALSFAEWQELERELREGGAHLERRALLDKVLERRSRTLRRGRDRDLPARWKMMEAARWLAALAAASGAERFTFGGGGDLDVLRVVPGELSEAAQALRDTVVLARTGGRDEDEWTFAAAHVAEDLAALFFAEPGRLDRLGEQRLRQLFTDGVEIRPGLARLAARTDDLTGGALTRRLTPSFGKARQILDAVFEASRAAGDDVPYLPESTLAHLGRPLDSETARERLAEPGGSVASRVLALRLAWAAQWHDLAPEAAAIARAGAEHVALRDAAVRLVLGASAVELVEPLVHEIDRDVADPELAKLRTTVLRELLHQRRITPAAAILLASAADDHHWDKRKLLLTELTKAVDLDAARVVIDDIRSGNPASLGRDGYDAAALSAAPLLPAAPSRIAPGVREELAPSAARLVLSAPSLAPEDLERLAFIAVFPSAFSHGHESVYDALRKAVEPRADLRRFLYERLDLRGIRSPYVIVHQQDDAGWLVERASELPERSPHVREDVYRAVRSLRGRGQDELAARGEALLRADGAWDDLEASAEESHRRLEEYESESAAWRDERRRAIERTLPLSAVVPKLLVDEREPSVRLHVLGDVVFGERRAARNVLGSFDDLSEETQHALIDATKKALKAATPSELPAGDRFSSTLLDEADAFRAVATWRPGADGLDAALVEAWLPVALFASTGETSDLVDVIEHCYDAAPAETIGALVGAMRREARRGFTYIVHRVPSRVRRDPRLMHALEALVRELAASAREADRDALRSLLTVYLDAGAPRKRERALLRELANHADAHVARAAAGTWLARRPADGWEAAAHLMVDEASTAEVFAPILSADWRVASAGGWPAEALAAIAPRIAEHVEAARLEPRGIMSKRDELQIARDGLIGTCLARKDEPAVSRALEKILPLSPRHAVEARRVDRWMDIRRVVDSFRDKPLKAGDVAEVLKSGLRFLGTAEDLAMTIREVLEEDWDPTWHLLLFDAEGERRNESAAQALLHLVLTHRLDRATSPDANVQMIREPLNRGHDRPDFEVRLEARAGDRLVVPIEVKWDHHPGWKTAIRTQLAERYCKTHHHGVYVVVTASRDPSEIRAALELEAAVIARDLGITIHVVVKDVREGRKDDPNGRKRTRSPTATSKKRASPNPATAKRKTQG